MNINFLLPHIGISGGVRVVFEYANRLSQRGHNVTVLYPIIPSRMVEKWSAPKPRITQVISSIKRFLSSNDVDWFDLDVPVKPIPTLAPNLIGYFENMIPDADITIATAWQTAYAVAALNESKGEKAYFIQHYEIWDTWNSNEAWNQVTSLTDNPSSYPIEMYEVTPADSKVKRQKYIVDSSYELPLAHITISSWLKELLETKFDQEVVGTIDNSVNHSTFYPEPTKESDTISLLLPTRDTAWKGDQEARVLVKEIGVSYDVDIHMFGSKPERDSYPDYVIQHPNISDRELRYLYSMADIFVLPSWVEGYGLPPLEAMACKCAVVATNVGAVPDYAEDGETALIVPPRNSTALIRAVCELIEDDEKRNQLQQQGYEHVQGYTWEDATTQFERTLGKITGS